LECGCGTGKNTVWLAQKAVSLTAMDFSEAMLEKAAEKLNTSHVTFVQADLTQRWPFEREAFDALTCNLVLEHIENLEPLFLEAARVLKKEGYFFVSELHPVKQYGGSKARFEKSGEMQVLPSFVHHASDYFKAATVAGLQCQKLDEWFDGEDKTAVPRLISFLFQKV
jgi:ubiquinone/menaquinone biosynthesis C-methylase UbiE